MRRRRQPNETPRVHTTKTPSHNSGVGKFSPTIQQRLSLLLHSQIANGKYRSIYINHRKVLLSFHRPPHMSTPLHVCLPSPPLTPVLAGERQKTSTVRSLRTHLVPLSPLLALPLYYRFLRAFRPSFRQMHRSKTQCVPRAKARFQSHASDETIARACRVASRGFRYPSGGNFGLPSMR